MAKLKGSQRILLASALIGLVIVGAVVSLVLVLAAQAQNVNSSISVSYQATEVAGNIKFSYKIAEREYVDVGTVSFNGSEETTTGNLNPKEDIALSSSERYVIFRYEITGHAEGGYYVSLEYQDKDTADMNNKVEYTISDTEITSFNTMNLTSPVGTITKNNHKVDNQKTYVYVKVSIAELTSPMNYDGNYNLVLSRNEWTDPNYDEATGFAYGLVGEGEEQYAALVNYDGEESDLTINTTTIYGTEMPVKIIRDYAFAAPQSSATNTLLTTLNIGENVERIENYAFAYNTSLTEVTIAKNVNYIATTAFYGCTNLGKIKNNSSVNITPQVFQGLPSNVVVSEPPKIQKEATQFNGRDYYYIEMGEYPQTFAGYEGSVSGLNSSNEVFTFDYNDVVNYTYEQNKQLPVYTKDGERYVKLTVNTNNSGTFSTNIVSTATTVTNGSVAYFKIEPIKWDIVGYYSNDDLSDASFVKCTTEGFNPNGHSQNMVVQARDALQGLQWNVSYSDVDYNNSTIYNWLQGFYTKVLEKGYADVIEEVTNQYTDTSANTSWSNITGGNPTMAGSVKEKVWIFDYTQANSTFMSDNANRRCAPSDFAQGTGAYQYVSTSYATITKPSGGTTYYWLRSSFSNGGNYYAGYVYNRGDIFNGSVSSSNSAVRPALLVNL